MDENNNNFWQTTQNCSFKFFTNSDCTTFPGFPNEIHKNLISKCNKNIESHLQNLSLNPKLIPSEGHLICFRAGVFSFMGQYSVCPYHRYTLGVRWRKGVCCSFPQHSGKAKPELKRTVNYKMSYYMMASRGHLMPVGSGICRSCRGILYKEMTDSNFDVDNEFLAVQNLPHTMIEDDKPTVEELETTKCTVYRSVS